MLSFAPMVRPYRQQMDCGTISAKITIKAVDMTRPSTPDEIPANKMDRKAANTQCVSQEKTINLVRER